MKLIKVLEDFSMMKIEDFTNDNLTRISISE